jgi:hypothetical protein
MPLFVTDHLHGDRPRPRNVPSFALLPENGQIYRTHPHYSSPVHLADPLFPSSFADLRLRRPTGRTMTHCYVEVSTADAFEELIARIDRKKMGGRLIRARQGAMNGLLRDVRS